MMLHSASNQASAQLRQIKGTVLTRYQLVSFSVKGTVRVIPVKTSLLHAFVEQMSPVKICFYYCFNPTNIHFRTITSF